MGTPQIHFGPLGALWAGPVQQKQIFEGGKMGSKTQPVLSVKYARRLGRNHDFDKSTPMGGQKGPQRDEKVRRGDFKGVPRWLRGGPEKYEIQGPPFEVLLYDFWRPRERLRLFLGSFGGLRGPPAPPGPSKSWLPLRRRAYFTFLMTFFVLNRTEIIVGTSQGRRRAEGL